MICSTRQFCGRALVSFIVVLLGLGGCGTNADEDARDRPEPDFEFTLSELSLHVVQGARARLTATLSADQGFDELVNFSVSGLPDGLAASWLPNPTNGQSELTLDVSNSAPAGTHSVEIVAVGGNSTKRRSVQVIVISPASGSLRVTIRGLPAGTDAEASLSGPDGPDIELTQSTTLTDLAPGSYSIVANAVMVDGFEYVAHVDHETPTLVAEQQSHVTMTYGRSANALGVDQPVVTGTRIEAGATQYFRVAVSQALAEGADRIMYGVDLAQDQVRDTSAAITLTVHDDDFEPFARAMEPGLFELFGANLTQAAISGAREESARIVVVPVPGSGRVCLGVCVLEPASTTERWLALANVSSDDVTLDVYSFGMHNYDATEPDNNLLTSAPSLYNVSSAQAGYLEVLNDVDYYRIEDGGTFYFDYDAPSSVEARANVFAMDGSQRTTLKPGQATRVQPDDYVRIESLVGMASPLDPYTVSLNK